MKTEHELIEELKDLESALRMYAKGTINLSSVQRKRISEKIHFLREILEVKER